MLAIGKRYDECLRVLHGFTKKVQQFFIIIIIIIIIIIVVIIIYCN